jgi:hypothetical protein
MPHSVATSRRKFERRALKVNAIIHCRGHFQYAKVVDYSTSGLQLEGTFGLITRDPVEVELISGTRIPGQVAWSLGCQTGIAFSEPLATSHPAFIELSQGGQ